MLTGRLTSAFLVLSIFSFASSPSLAPFANAQPTPGEPSPSLAAAGTRVDTDPATAQPDLLCLYLDDLRMTGVHGVTGEDVPLLVVLGSSTAAGTGASSPDSSWVGRFRTYVHDINPDAVVLNLAVGGYTTYHIRESGYAPPAGRPAPSPEHNITHALACKPWGIIVNLPSNDVAAGYTLEEQLRNDDAVKALADAAGVPIWFSTAQPRNFAAPAQRDVLIAQTDSTVARFGSLAIDFWNGVAAADGTILPEYDCGDGIHLNDSGHALLFSRVVDTHMWSRAAPRNRARGGSRIEERLRPPQPGYRRGP